MALVKQISIKNTSGSYETRDIAADAKNIDVPLDASGNVAVGSTAVASHSNVAQMIKNNKDALAGKAATSTVNNHISATASTTTAGHIKLGTGFTQSGGATSVAFASNGQSGAGLAVQANDSRLSNARPNPNALTFADGSSYNGSAAKTINAASVGALSSGHASTAASSSTLGHVKTSTGLNNSSGTISVAYGTSAGTACQGNDSRLSNSRNPVAHATTSTTYGGGNISNYGHVKLSDSYNTTPNQGSYGANACVGASLYAVQKAYSDLNAKLKSATDKIESSGIGDERWYSLTNEVTYKRKNGFIFLRGDCRGAVTIPKNIGKKVLGTLPEVYRPGWLYYVPINPIGINNGYNLSLTIDINGELTIINFNPNESVSYWSFLVSYPTYQD